jgi:hypothetical protein
VTYTGNRTAGATIGHGLGAAPKMVIVKSRDDGTTDWFVYHAGIASDAETDYIRLNTTDIASDNNTIWNDTKPTSSVFTLGTNGQVNETGESFIAYCFAEVEGYSKFGSYTGNGSADGPFVYTGFRPAFVLLKITNAAENWVIFDDARSEYNLSQLGLYPNSSGAEVTIASNGIDMLSNGFKLRGTGTRTNGSVYTYIYACFSENPFKNSLAR